MYSEELGRSGVGEQGTGDGEQDVTGSESEGRGILGKDGGQVDDQQATYRWGSVEAVSRAVGRVEH